MSRRSFATARVADGNWLYRIVERVVEIRHTDDRKHYLYNGHGSTIRRTTSTGASFEQTSREIR